MSLNAFGKSGFVPSRREQAYPLFMEQLWRGIYENNGKTGLFNEVCQVLYRKDRAVETPLGAITQTQD